MDNKCNDKYNLSRFVKAQEQFFDSAYAEISSGRKRGHWMWFIFPQLKELGYSETALFYGITCLDEAREYLKNDYLRQNLVKITRALLDLPNDECHSDPEMIMGRVDDLKLQSSMTLFANATDDNELFLDVLKRYYHSRPCQRTLELIS